MKTPCRRRLSRLLRGRSLPGKMVRVGGKSIPSCGQHSEGSAPSGCLGTFNCCTWWKGRGRARGYETGQAGGHDELCTEPLCALEIRGRH